MAIEASDQAGKAAGHADAASSRIDEACGHADFASSAEAQDPYCLSPGEAATLLREHPWRRFAVLGDSVASGVGDMADGYSVYPWADRIAAELKATAPDFAYLNLGEREMLAADVRERQLARALAFRPDLALVACGGNDALRKTYRADAVDTHLRAIIAALREAGADVITIGMFDASHAPSIPDRLRDLISERMRTLSTHTASVSQALGGIHVRVTGHPVEPDVTMYSVDGLHGNMRSHAICAAEAIREQGRRLDARR
jgi:lysophospholipase L1-like esterase